MRGSDVLARYARDLAAVVPEVDVTADHERWQPGIAPFEEDRQLSMLHDALSGSSAYEIRTEVQYPTSDERCDIVLSMGAGDLPIEAKLLRFRYDNGNVDPNAFPKVFSPFPESSSSSLLTDAVKLRESGFEQPGALLGLYYEPRDEPYEQLTPERIADKLCRDLDYWYGIAAEVRTVERVDGLRHPVHERGAIIAWSLD